MPAVGIVRETITNASKGEIVVTGKIENQNTSLYSTGDPLYVSETDGVFTDTKPDGTALVQKIGFVIYSDAVNGVIEIIGAGRTNDLPNLATGKLWIGDANGVPSATTPNTGFNLNLGTSAGTVAEGNHTHTVSDITDFTSNFNSSFDTRLGTKDTDDLSEGSINKYYTDARVSTWVDTQKGAVNGIASLDGSGKVPSSQLSLTTTIYQGMWNASTNTPTLVSSTGTQGHYYVVSVAGSTNIDGITDWQLNDWIIFNGSVWEKNDNSDQVTSVAGKQGAVTLVLADITDLSTTTDLPEGTNLYYTEARVTANTSVAANTSHAANTSNPHSVTKSQIGLGEVLNIKHKIDAIKAPTASNDSSENYSVGSIWSDVTNDKTYICIDSTASGAIWKRIDITSHLDLSDIGLNDHTQIDTHIGDNSIHFTEASIDHGSTRERAVTFAMGPGKEEGCA